MNSISKVVICLATAASLSGCSTIIEGTSQKIAVATAPSGAYCTLQRDGQTIATVASSPAVVRVDKTKDDILINCSVAGYAPASQYLHSGIATGTYGNIIAGGLVGWGVDSMTGADNEYPGAVNMSLAPLPAGENVSRAQISQTTPISCTKEDREVARLARENGYQYSSACI